MTNETLTAEPFLSGLFFGECPRWHEGRLWYSDFFDHAVLSVSPEGERRTEVAFEGEPAGLGWLPDGRLLINSRLDRRHRAPRAGRVAGAPRRPDPVGDLARQRHGGGVQRPGLRGELRVRPRRDLRRDGRRQRRRPGLARPRRPRRLEFRGRRRHRLPQRHGDHRGRAHPDHRRERGGQADRLRPGRRRRAGPPPGVGRARERRPRRHLPVRGRHHLGVQCLRAGVRPGRRGRRGPRTGRHEHELLRLHAGRRRPPDAVPGHGAGQPPRRSPGRSARAPSRRCAPPSRAPAFPERARFR